MFGLNPNSTYAYYVVSSNGNGESTPSNVVTVTTPPDIIAPSIHLNSSVRVSNEYLKLSGTASDNARVDSVTWESNQGYSGIAQGTSYWTVTAPLKPWSFNTITVTATDAGGNKRSVFKTVLRLF
jgi:hypothetical protein